MDQDLKENHSKNSESSFLLLDIGNTLHKLAVFSVSGKIMFVGKYPAISLDIIRNVASKFNICHSIVSSVGSYHTEIDDYLKNHLNPIFLSYLTPLPISIGYSSPESLGVDRIANAVGAHSLFPGQNVLSVQMGSCMVNDFVNCNNEYMGGSISPGIDMRLKALNYYTRNLPLIEKSAVDYFLGNNTQQSILSGVMNGIVYEINGFINQYEQKYGSVKVLITGGDSLFIHESIKNAIFATQNLVLKGLYIILKFNVETY